MADLLILIEGFPSQSRTFLANSVLRNRHLGTQTSVLAACYQELERRAPYVLAPSVQVKHRRPKRAVELSPMAFISMVILSFLGIAYLSALLVNAAHAAPVPHSLTVIHDTGTGIAAEAYYEPFRGVQKTVRERGSPTMPPPMAMNLTNFLPVSTPAMSPGRVLSRATKYPNLPQPFFVLGTDEFSSNWLSKHRDRLHEMKATGIVVEAAGTADFNQLQAIAGPIKLVPLPGKEIARLFEIQRYPVVVTTSGIEQ